VDSVAHGAANLRSKEQGNLFCKINVEVPRKLNAQQKKALKELEAQEV